MGISIGLVGLGSFGQSFADLFKHHPLVDRVALCDREPDRIERFAGKESWRDKFDAKDAYGSLDEILPADLDALVIITADHGEEMFERDGTTRRRLPTLSASNRSR